MSRGRISPRKLAPPPNAVGGTGTDSEPSSNPSSDNTAPFVHESGPLAARRPDVDCSRTIIPPGATLAHSLDKQSAATNALPPEEGNFDGAQRRGSTRRILKCDNDLSNAPDLGLRPPGPVSRALAQTCFPRHGGPPWKRRQEALRQTKEMDARAPLLPQCEANNCRPRRPRVDASSEPT